MPSGWTAGSSEWTAGSSEWSAGSPGWTAGSSGSTADRPEAGGAGAVGSSDTGRPVAPERPPFGNPTLRFFGHYTGTDSQLDALRITDPARGRAPAGMDTAMLAYSGISVKMMVDPGLGSELCTMFMVDYEPGGAAQVHDHPFEEAYLFLQGEIEGEIDGEVRTFRAGEVLFCGVGVLHGFFNTSGGHVRWIETQVPEPLPAPCSNVSTLRQPRVAPWR